MRGPVDPGVNAVPWVSVVIPNLDGERWLAGCLPTLASAQSQGIEVVVSDDGSRDGSRAAAEHHGARFIDAPSRATGFAATANRGLRAAMGEWLLLLNNDTEIDEHALDELHAAATRHPEAAMLAPLVRSLRDRGVIDSAGMLLYPDGTARPRWHGREVNSVTLLEEEVLVPSGAAAMIRRDWLERVGYLDEGLVSYIEDIDLGLRIRRAGGTAIFVPRAVVFHYFSGTTGALSPAKARLIERNHITVGVRHLPLRDALLLPVWTALRWSAVAAGVLRARRQAGGGRRDSPAALLLAALRGTCEGVLRLPRSIAERRAATAAGGMDDAAWSRLLRRHRARLRDYLRFGE